MYVGMADGTDQKNNNPKPQNNQTPQQHWKEKWCYDFKLLTAGNIIIHAWLVYTAKNRFPSDRDWDSYISENGKSRGLIRYFDWDF